MHHLVFAGLACRFEWFFTAGDLSDIKNVSPAEWAYIAQLSLVALLAFGMIYEFSPTLSTKVSSNIKAGLFILFGCGNVVTSALVAKDGKESDAKIAWRFITGVPWLAKLLRTTWFVNEYSLVALAIIDVLFNMTAADLGFVVLLQLD